MCVFPIELIPSPLLIIDNLAKNPNRYHENFQHNRSLGFDPHIDHPTRRRTAAAMATRPAALRTISRALSSAPAAARTRAALAGSRVDTTAYTDTGGSGADSTALSSSLAEASAKAVATYRSALRDIPAMRQNFTILEEREFIMACIRDLFERHGGVTDPKIVDMLVFKARQELREIREQWKSRHHLYGYIVAYHEKCLKEEAARVASLHVDQSDGRQDAQREEILMAWRERHLVPADVQNWAQYLRWKEEEAEKFNAFAVDNKLFTQEQLERNAAASPTQCTIM